MDKMGSKKGMDEFEVMDSDSQKIAAMLGALPRVEAPSNFEFGVKAKIANGSPSRSALLPLLKTAAPFALILIVLGLGLFFFQRPNGTDVDPINNLSTLPLARTESAPVAPSVVSSPPLETGGTQRQRTAVESRRTLNSQRVVTSSSGNRAQGGSVDRIIHPANVIMPPGTESANPQKLNANTTSSSMADAPVREVLGILGIEGDFADGGWKVRSVKENGLGSRAKIAAGDVIESIDGQPVRSDSKLNGNAKTFIVRRNGKSITLSAGN